MAKKATPKTETAESLRFDYIQHAKYYFFRAEGNEEHLESVLHRSQAMNALQRMQALGVEPPPPEDIKAAASETWSGIKLHADR